MALSKIDIQKEIEKHWPAVKENIAKFNKEVVKLAKESEKNLVVLSKKVKKTTEQLILKAKREELYYELGKVIAPILTPDQLKEKKILTIHNALKKVDKKLHSRK